MNGADFLDFVKEVSPCSVRLMLSAYISQDTLFEIINKSEVFRFINKPWKDVELLSIIQESISKYDRDIRISRPIPEFSIKENIQLPQEHVQESSSENLVERDHYFDDILPRENFEAFDSKKLCEVLRFEQHQHLNYIINMVSSRIGNHCKRVSQLSVYVGNIMKLNAKAQKNLYYAGMYHDVGKLFELAAQADHCEIGASLLSNFQELKEAANIIRYHHKRLDEEGASSIPVESKILCIVDCFDKEISAEVNHELEEKPKTLPSILAAMEHQKNIKFDAETFEVFKDVILNNFKLEMFFSERKIHIVELEEGMVLSRPLFNVEEKMLLNSEYKITKDLLKRLLKHHDLIGIKNPFYVYEKSPDKKFNFEEFIAKKIKV